MIDDASISAGFAHAFGLYFIMWVVVESQVLAWLRTPVERWLDGRGVVASYVAYFVTCRICMGFWVSLILTQAWDADWRYVAAINGMHLLLVMIERQRVSQPVDTIESIGLYVGDPKAAFEAFYGNAPIEAQTVVVDFLDHMYDDVPDATFSDLYEAIGAS